MGFANSTFGSKNRTSVLYDFSIVKKAVFYVFKKTGSEGTGLITYEPAGNHVLYAQINPYELKLDSGSKRRRQQTALAREKEAEVKNKSIDLSYESRLSMELIYDVYDEHMVGTLDGMLTGVQNIDLTEEGLTSLPALVELSRLNDHFVFFKWGSTEFFGSVESVDFTYKAFSRFGFPLKAVGNVTLISEGDEIDGVGNIVPFLKQSESVTISAEAKSADKIDSGFLYAEIGATEALR